MFEGALDFLNQIPVGDKIVFITLKSEEYKEMTLEFLEENGIPYDHIIFNAPYGERMLVNGRKPSGKFKVL